MTDALRFHDTWPTYGGKSVLTTDGRYLHFSYGEGFDGDIEIVAHRGGDPKTTIRFPESALLEFVSECYVLPKVEGALSALIGRVRDAKTDPLAIAQSDARFWEHQAKKQAAWETLYGTPAPDAH